MYLVKRGFVQLSNFLYFWQIDVTISHAHASSLVERSVKARKRVLLWK